MKIGNSRDYIIQYILSQFPKPTLFKLEKISLRMRTVDKIIHLISWVANVPTTQILPSTDIKLDLNVDSIDFMLFIVKMEKLFDINLPNEDVERIETVKDATDFVERQLC